MPGKFFGVFRLPNLMRGHDAFHQRLGLWRDTTAPRVRSMPRLTALFRALSWVALAAALTVAVIGLRVQVDGVILFPPPAGINVGLILLTSGAGGWSAWLRSFKMSNFRAAVILLPLLLFPAFAWWTWRTVQETGNERAQRIVSALADQTHRVLDVQEAMLKSALARVRGRAPDEIAADASLSPFLADLGLGISGELMIVEPETKRILASSRKGALGEAGLSKASWPPANHEGVYVGEFTSLGPAGETGFTVSQRDRQSGIIAVSWLSFDDSIPLSFGMSQSSRDAVTLARADGTVLLMHPAGAASVGERLRADSSFMRWVRGELSTPAIAAFREDGVDRLWQIKKVEGHPVYAIYGLDTSTFRSDWLRDLAPFGLLALFSSGALTFLTGRLQRSAAEAEAARAEAKAQRAMAEISKRLELALEVSSTGVWEWNPETDAITLSKELRDILGITSFGGTREAFYRLVHPDDAVRNPWARRASDQQW